MKIFKKNGQIYLISTVVLISILSIILVGSNSIEKNLPSNLEYFSENIKIESEKLMDYDLKHNTSHLEEFTKNVSKNLDNETSIYFVIGMEGELDCFGYENGEEMEENVNCAEEGSKIKLNVERTEYNFPLYSEGKHFYFLIIKENQGERYVYKG